MDRTLRKGVASTLLTLVLVAGAAGTAATETAAAAVPAAEAPGAEAGAEHGGEAADAHHKAPKFTWLTWFVDDAESGDPTHDYGPGFFWAIVNFAALLILLSWLLGKPIRQFVHDRHHKVRDAIDAAKKAQAQAEARHREYLEKMERLEADARALENEILGEARREANRIIERAKERSERIAADAERAVQAEIVVARQTLEREVARAALGAAEKLVRDKLQSEDKQRLEDEFLKQISS